MKIEPSNQAEKEIVKAAVACLLQHGWNKLLLHYDDGSVLLKWPDDKPPPCTECGQSGIDSGGEICGCQYGSRESLQDWVKEAARKLSSP